MNGRSGWMIGGGVVVLLAAVVAVIWWSTSGAPSPAASPTPSASATRDAQAEAQAALDEHLDDCVDRGAPNGAVPAGCGIRIPWGSEFASVTDVRFRVERMPRLVFTEDDGFTADGGVLVATVTGTGQDGVARTETYRTESWGVRGEVEQTADDIDVIVW